MLIATVLGVALQLVHIWILSASFGNSIESDIVNGLNLSLIWAAMLAIVLFAVTFLVTRKITKQLNWVVGGLVGLLFYFVLDILLNNVSILHVIESLSLHNYTSVLYSFTVLLGSSGHISGNLTQIVYLTIFGIMIGLFVPRKTSLV